MRFTPKHTFLLVPAVAVLLALSGTATSGTSQRPVYQPPQSYYLALGDSMTYGFQPNKPNTARPSAFDTGYVDVFAANLRKLSPKIKVVNYGCPGESTKTFVHGGCSGRGDVKGLHDAFKGAQLEAALAFLRAHRGQVSPITVTLWGNDVPLPLSQNAKRAPSAIASFGSRLTSILKQLRATAPTSEIIVTGAWNPEADRLAKGSRSTDRSTRRSSVPQPRRAPGSRTCSRRWTGPETSRLSRLGFARSPSSARRAIRIRPTPGTARWPPPSWLRRATRGSHRRFRGPIRSSRNEQRIGRPPGGRSRLIVLSLLSGREHGDRSCAFVCSRWSI